MSPDTSTGTLHKEGDPSSPRSAVVLTDPVDLGGYLPGPGPGSWAAGVPKKSSPPPYGHSHYKSTPLSPPAASANLLASSTLPAPSSTSGSSSFSGYYSGGSIPGYPSMHGSSFTNTFLRGILTSIDSKDPVVANAWLETLLDAIDLLPADVIKREIISIALAKGQSTQSISSRVSSCRLLGKVATKLDHLTVRHEVLPSTLVLCQDEEAEVRNCMCRHLALVARGVGLEATKSTILPQLVELSSDDSGRVRLSALETVVHLLNLLDEETSTQVIVPLVMKSCDQAQHLEDESLPNIAHYLGRLCHGLTPNLQPDQKNWFIDFYRHLSRLGTTPNSSQQDSVSNPMPDLVPVVEDKTEMHVACRRECAFNFPAFVIFVGPQSFSETLYPTFAHLAGDCHPAVRKTLAASLHEVARIVGTTFRTTKQQVRDLFADHHVEVLESMIANLVHVIDALARCGVLQFGQSGQYSDDLSAALLRCEDLVAQTRNWRLHADCLEKFSCLANCISPKTIQQKFIPMLFGRILRARALPCRNAATRTMLVILRFTIKMEDRAHIMFRIQDELAHGKSCHTRMLFLRLCDMSMSLFSKSYFKQHFFREFLSLSADPVANIRMKLCTMLPKLKSLLFLPSDRSLLQQLEETVKGFLVRESDRDVLGALQRVIEELDTIDMGVDGVPSMDAEEDRENERKLREERLIYSMEEQMSKIHSAEFSPNRPYAHLNENAKFSFPSPRLRELALSESSRRGRSESLPPPVIRGDSSSSPVLPKPRFNSPEPSRTYSHEAVASFGEGGNNSSLPSPWTTVDYEPNQERSSSSPFTRQPYSISLENLDSSAAKEFLVDTGVTLDLAKQLSTATSMPNLSKSSTPGMPNLEGAFSKFLISNAEMEQYEAEYKRASEELSGKEAKEQPARHSRPESRLRPPSTSSSSLLKQPSPSGIPTHKSASQLPRLSLSSKMSSSTDKLQGSFERLAEKWEAKRKNLLSGELNDSTSAKRTAAALTAAEQLSEDRAVIMEQKLQTIKQQSTIPTWSMTSKVPPAAAQQKRTSLSDQVGRFVQQSKRKSLDDNLDGSEKSDSEPEDTATRLMEEATRLIKELGSGSTSRKLSDDELPPYPKVDKTYVALDTAVPLPPPPSSGEDMVTYVPPVSDPAMLGRPSSSSSLPLTSLVVKPISSSSVSGISRMIPLQPRLSQQQQPQLASQYTIPRTLPQIPRASRPDSGKLFSPSPVISPSQNSAPRTSMLPSPQRKVIPPPPPPSLLSRSSIRLLPQQPQQQQPPPYQRPPVYSQSPQIRKQMVNPSVNQGSLALPSPPPTPLAPPQRKIHFDESENQQQQQQQQSKYTRLPPPKYRPHQPPSQRRPLSHQESSSGSIFQDRIMQKQQQQNPGLKSLSAECILEVQKSRMTPVPFAANDCSSSTRRMSYNSDGNSSGSPSPQSSGGSSSSGDQNSDHLPASVKDMMLAGRKSSGLRMWQGHHQQQQQQLAQRPRPTSAPEQDLMQLSNSPGPFDGQAGKLLLQSRLRKPTQPRRVYQRNSYGGPNASTPSATSARGPRSAHGSPASSRSTSPHYLQQQQPPPQLRRRSAQFSSSSGSCGAPASQSGIPSSQTHIPSPHGRQSQVQYLQQQRSGAIPGRFEQQQQPMYHRSQPQLSQQHPYYVTGNNQTVYSSHQQLSRNFHDPTDGIASSSVPNTRPAAAASRNNSSLGLPAPGFMSRQGGSNYVQRSM